MLVPVTRDPAASRAQRVRAWELIALSRFILGDRGGARTAFDFRVHSGTFACDTNVQGDATPLVGSEILAEFEGVGGTRPVGADDLERAKS